MLRDKRRLTIAVLSVSNMFTQCCRALISPFFPLVAAQKGVSETVVGLIFSSAEFTIFLTSPLFGSLMSHVDPRFIYITGLCVYGSCELMFGYKESKTAVIRFLDGSPPGTQFISICLAVRVVEATGTAALMTSSYAIAGNTYPEKIATVYSIIQTSVAMGYMVGPAVGGVIYQTGGHGLPFWTLGSCVLLCGVISMVLLPRQDGKCLPQGDNHNFLPSEKSSCMFCCNIHYVQYDGYISVQPHIDSGSGPVRCRTSNCRIHLPSTSSHLLTVRTTMGRPARQEAQGDAVAMASSGLLVSILILLLFGPAPFLSFIPNVLWLKIVSATLLGVTVAVAAVGGVNSIVQGARHLGFKDDGSTFGLVAALSQTSSCCGGFVGPLLGGAVTEYSGFGSSLVVVAVIFLLPVCFGFLLAYKRKRIKRGIGIQRPNFHRKTYNSLQDDDELEGTHL